jgi:hypothetical protein
MDDRGTVRDGRLCLACRDACVIGDDADRAQQEGEGEEAEEAGAHVEMTPFDVRSMSVVRASIGLVSRM